MTSIEFQWQGLSIVREFDVSDLPKFGCKLLEVYNLSLAARNLPISESCQTTPETLKWETDGLRCVGFCVAMEDQTSANATETSMWTFDIATLEIFLLFG